MLASQKGPWLPGQFLALSEAVISSVKWSRNTQAWKDLLWEEGASPPASANRHRPRGASAGSLLPTDEGHLALGFWFLAPLDPGVGVAQTGTSQMIAFRTKGSKQEQRHQREGMEAPVHLLPI